MSLKSLFDHKSNKKVFDTDGFYIGLPEAEAEAKDTNKIEFIDFYMDYLEISDQIDSGKFIIIGRKGSGKSAFAAYLKKKTLDSYNTYVDFVTRTDILITNKIIEHENEINPSIFFEWVILLKIVKYIIYFENIFDDGIVRKLKNFYSINSGFLDILSYDTKKILSSDEILVNAGPITALYNILFHYKKENEKFSEKAPFFKLIPSLKEIVKKAIELCSNEIEFYMFVDDIDIDFKSYNKNTVSLVAELIRVAKEYNNLLEHLGIKIIILIRDDILHYINTNSADMSKIIQSYGFFLEWYDYQLFSRDLDSLPLKCLIDRRIDKNLRLKKINTRYPWSTMLGDDNYSFFKKLIDITFARPRDLILFFKTVPSLKMSFPITDAGKKKLIYNYTNAMIGELKNEFYNFYHPEQVELLFKTIKKLSRKIMTKDELRKALDDVRFKGDSEGAIENLFDRSIIGHFFKEKGYVSFKYRQQNHGQISFDDHDIFIFHKALHSNFPIF